MADKKADKPSQPNPIEQEQGALSSIMSGGSTLTRAPITGPRLKTESKLFTVNIALNPLIAACAPLLSINSQLREQGRPPNLTELQQQLSHEVKAFENKAHQLGYHSQMILAARYLLCALIDETILTTDWGRDSTWQTDNLLHSFQRETWGGERFFVILDRAAEDPKLYIDLLELGYICLSLGFQGKYRKAEQHHDFASLIDNLYDLTRQQRGEFSRHLLVGKTNDTPKRITYLKLPPIWTTAVATVVILVLIFIPYHHRLNKLSAPLQHNIMQLEQYAP